MHRRDFSFPAFASGGATEGRVLRQFGTRQVQATGGYVPN
jgi:hypothetical protein